MAGIGPSETAKKAVGNMNKHLEYDKTEDSSDSGRPGGGVSLLEHPDPLYPGRVHPFTTFPGQERAPYGIPRASFGPQRTSMNNVYTANGDDGGFNSTGNGMAIGRNNRFGTVRDHKINHAQRLVFHANSL